MSSQPPVAETSKPTDAIFTIPNILSFARLLGVPVFLWLLLGPHADGWALAILMVSGFTDWADGVLARKLNQDGRTRASLPHTAGGTRAARFGVTR